MPEPVSEAVVVAPMLAASSPAEKKREVESLLGGIFNRMDYPARLEFKDMPDGGLGVAVHFNGELPGISGSKRTYLVDCIQFLVNKVVNRPNVEKRWVTLGVNAFPEPRSAKSEPSAPQAPKASAPPPQQQQARASAPAQAPAQTQQRRPDAKPAPVQQQPQRNNRSNENDERSMKVDPRPAMTRMGTALAEKSAKHGRFYGVTLLPTDDRARVIAAAANVKGVSLKTEGEGYFRRVVFVPAQPAVIAKKQVMPDYDDEE